MAEMAKKLHFLKSGTEQTAKAYSTTAETGGSYITNSIDNTTVYVPIVGTSDSRATVGRVLKSGTTYAIATTGKPPYAEKSWTTAGTYTWTAPAGVTRVRVAVCGGGGGAAGKAVSTSSDSWHYAGSGGTSQFGALISASGGTGGGVIYDYAQEGSDYYNGSGGKGGSPNGRAGTWQKSKGSISGGTGFSLSFSLANGSYGNGGGCGNAGTLSHILASGGSGGYNSSYVNVSSGSTYTIVVGGGGNTYAYNSRTRVNKGNSGFVLIAYGGNI